MNLKTPLFWRESYISEFGLLKDSVLVHDGYLWRPTTNNNLDPLKPSMTLIRGEKKWASPLSATFGGIHKGGLSLAREHDLVQSLIKYLTEQQISEIEITLPPDHTNYEFMVGIDAYLESGFTVSYSNINHYLSLTDWNHESLSKGNRKKLRQAKEIGLEYISAAGIEILEAYQVISRNRESLGAKVSLEYATLIRLMSIFSEEYKCHILKSESGEIAAASFVVETSADNLYVYLWADVPNFRHVSPLVLLLDNLVRTYQHKFKSLDLGTSAIQGVTIEGLSRFKDNLGASQSSKKTIKWKNPAPLMI
jgi:hypothetical protein